MADQKRLRRAYDGPDDFMLQTVRVIRHLFEEDIAQFSAFDPVLDATWLANWQSELDLAEGTASDYYVRAGAAIETETVTEAMQAARQAWPDIKYFIRQAYPRDAAMLLYFGSAAFKKARMSQPRMIEFLKGLHSAATEHSSVLIGAGYAQERIDAIAATADALITKNDVQNAAVRSRPKATAARIATLNAPYLRMVRVNSAAQIIFSNSYAKRKQYTFGYKPRKKRVK